MKKVKILVLVSALFLLQGFNANAQDANTILKKMDDVMFSSKDMTGKQKIILIDKAGKEKYREATIKQKGTNMRMFVFTSPASQEGIAFLSLPGDIMYLYLPAFGKERRIATSAKNQNFAGTDFTYEDMESKSYYDNYTPKLLGTEANAYVLELIPKSKKSSYSKLIVKIHKTDYYPIGMICYDKGNNKTKIAKYTFKKVGEYWRLFEVEMTDLKKNHKTKMQMYDAKYDTGLSDDEFTIRKLIE
jgi:outer membrane lipoprotein-sorting protein